MEDQDLSNLVKNIIAVKPLLHQVFGKPFPLNADITPAAYYLMVYLKNTESVSMSGLGKLLLILQPNVTALINKLIAKGFVIRTSDKADRRIIKIRLSSKGLQFMESSKKKYMKNVEKSLSVLSDDELKIFSASFQTVRAMMTKIYDTNTQKK